jgi:predicted membrane-bound mannosyltransferase
MAIAVGGAADEVYERMKSRGRIAAVLLLGPALTISAIQCIRLNFYHYDDERYAYVYAHTQREFLGLVSDIEEAANRAGTGEATAIAVTSPDYWPLPWYLRRYRGVGYFGKVTNNGAPIVVGSEAQQQQLEEDLGEGYVRAGSYTLRPGVVLLLYTRRDLAAG